jgi:hypothetical protein
MNEIQDCLNCGRDMIDHHRSNMKCYGGFGTYYREVTKDNFNQSFDARVWARQFVQMGKQNPSIATDEATMIGWFANAIMRGYDEHERKPRLLEPEEGNK